LFSITAKLFFSQSTARSPDHHVACTKSSPREKYLREDLFLLELLSDNLLDLPEDFLVNVTVTILGQQQTLCGQYKVRVKVQTSSKERDNTSNAGATTWIKDDKKPNFGHFTRNQGVKQIPSDPTKESETIELFFGDNFFEMLCKETNWYYFQVQGKYTSSSKEFKWVDVSVADMKNFFCNNHSHGPSKKRRTKRLLV
jgi:hypothetical protein